MFRPGDGSATVLFSNVHVEDVLVRTVPVPSA